MIRYLFIINFLLSASVYSQSGINTAVNLPQTLEPFVPEGWKAIALAEGDLNKDGIADAALVIEETNLNNFAANNEGFGPEVLNVNPRKMLVLFGNKEKNKYVIVTTSSGLIPSPNSIDSPCLEDPFLDEGDLKIQKGLLVLQLYTFSSCGSWSTSLETYKFRFNGAKNFTLIGYDCDETHRANNEITETSINFLTKKKSVIKTTFVEDEESENKPVTKWSSIKLEKLLTLEDLQWDTEMDF